MDCSRGKLFACLHARGFVALFESGDRVVFFVLDVGYNLLWLRLFEVQALEIGRRNLERVENQARGFAFNSFLARSSAQPGE